MNVNIRYLVIYMYENCINPASAIYSVHVFELTFFYQPFIIVGFNRRARRKLFYQPFIIVGFNRTARRKLRRMTCDTVPTTMVRISLIKGQLGSVFSDIVFKIPSTYGIKVKVVICGTYKNLNKITKNSTYLPEI